jgi:hypothetical protein
MAADAERDKKHEAMRTASRLPPLSLQKQAMEGA